MENPSTPISIHLDDLRIDLIGRLAMVLAVGGGLLAWLTTAYDPWPRTACLIYLALMIFGVWVKRINERRTLLARRLLVAGLLAAWLVSLTVNDSPWLLFPSLPLVFICALLIRHGELIAAAAAFAGPVGLELAGLRVYPMGVYSACLGLTLLAAWMAVSMVYTSMSWYRSTLQQSNQLLKETREHRGELSRALKSLKLANDLQRRTEQDLIRARQRAEEAQRIKEQFAASVSHELRTPLALILGFSEVMYNTPHVYGDLTWPPMLRRDISMIYRSSRHLLSMIDDILNLSRFQLAGFSLTLEPTNLEALVNETAEIAADLFRGRPVALEAEITGELPTLMIDRTRIRQVLLNLVNNASRFTETGSVRIGARIRENDVVLSVHDTGPGIPPEQHELIFQEFHQVEANLLRGKGGAGLGLAICRNFVEAHGGRIWVESNPGQGSTFFFTLPVRVPVSLPPEEDVYAARLRAGEQPRVVCVGMDSSGMAMLRRYLSGYELVQASSPDQVHELVQFHRPRAVVWNAPPEAPADPPPTLLVPVIHCSLPNPGWLVQKLGVAACISKPIQNERLIQEIKHLENPHSVLIIDDDRGFIQLVERVLLSAEATKNCEIRRAYDGAQGLEAMQMQQPDLVLLDLLMPEVDGYQVVEAMKADAQLREVPIILLTANNYPEPITGAENSQVSITCQGGLRPAEVLKLVQETLATLEPRVQEGSEAKV